MKYLIMPLVKVLWCLVTFAMLPLILLIQASLALWHWEFKYLRSIKRMYLEEFSVQYDYIETDETYYVYRNPIDYVLGRKTLVVKDKFIRMVSGGSLLDG